MMGTSIAFYGEITASNGRWINQTSTISDGADEKCAAGDSRAHRGERRASGGNWGAGVAGVGAGAVQRDFCGNGKARSGAALEPRGLPEIFAAALLHVEHQQHARTIMILGQSWRKTLPAGSDLRQSLGKANSKSRRQVAHVFVLDAGHALHMAGPMHPPP